MSVQGNSGGYDQTPALLKSTSPPENSAPPKLTVPPENWARLKVAVPAGELQRLVAEVAAVKDNAREVEVQALPGHRSVFFEVRGDDPDDGVADFADGLEGKSFRLGSVLAGIGLVWHARVGAQHIDAGLPVFPPVISQTRQIGIGPS